MKYFFCFGYPKSGTTYLQMLLESHPELSCPAEHKLYVLFDGDIKHSVPECRGKRIVVASNWYFDLKGYCEKGKKTTKAETDDWLEHK